jgi:serine/threonine protein kinase
VKPVESGNRRFEPLLGSMLKLDITQRLDFDPTSVSEALPPGTQTDRYRLFEAVSEDDLGIVYRALDLKLQCQVAVKEYLPRLIASRGDSGSVEPRGAAIVETFQAGVRDFAEDAKALRALQIRSVVRVLRVWLANGTAYRAMPWIAGTTLASRLLAERVARGSALSPSRSTVDSVAVPLLQSVQAIHQRGRLHGRLSPSNVYITTESAIVLFGFRAKPPSTEEASWSESDTAALACRPIELASLQASAPGVDVPGPWSDIYSVGALMHLMVTGRLPAPACIRLTDDDYEPLGEQTAPNHDAHLLLAIDWALNVEPDKRPRDIAQFRRRLQADQPATGKRARNLSTFVSAAPDALHLRAVPEGEPVGQAASTLARNPSLSRKVPNDFVSTRPMVYGDHQSEGPAATTQAPDAEAAPAPEPPSVMPPAPPPFKSSEPAVARSAHSGWGPLDESAFNSKAESAGPDVKFAEPPRPPLAKPAPKTITPRARKIIALIVFVCLVLFAALTWWLLDPWIRPTIGSSALQMHRPAAAPAPSPPASNPISNGYSAPIDMGGSKAANSTSATAAGSATVPAAAPKRLAPVPPSVPTSTPATRHSADSARHVPPPTTHKRTDGRCSDLLSKQSLGAAPPSSKPTDPGCP